MRALLTLHDRVFTALEATAPWLIPTLARIVFAGTLLVYYWNAGLNKFDGSPFSLSFGAYGSMLPRVFEAAGYDVSQLGPFATSFALAGSWAELILPALILVGLFTRLAAIGMTGFVIVQSWVDIFGHGVGEATIGAWFNNTSSDAILDQRAFWVFLFVVLILRGAGPISVDALLGRYRSADLTPASQPR